MSRTIRLTTPEGVEVDYELAGLGSRSAAAALDHLIQLGLLVVPAIGVLAIAGALNGLAAGRLSDAPIWASAVVVVWSFLVFFGYHAFFEVAWAGQSPGKRRLGLRVIRMGGRPPDVLTATIRNLVRMVDLIPPLYGIGALSLLWTRRYQRLGDLAAGTLVIKERGFGDALGGRLQPAGPAVAAYMEALPDPLDLQHDEFLGLLRFTERRSELAIVVQAHVAMRLCLPVLQRLELDLPVNVQWDYADIAEAMARSHVRQKGMI